MPAALLTWSDRGGDPSAAHHSPRPRSDSGPIVRLLEQTQAKARYHSAWVLTTPSGQTGAAALCEQMRQHIEHVELKVLDIDDPTDHHKLFVALAPLVTSFERLHPRHHWEQDVVLSAGTPQCQTLWVIMVQAGILATRMLQVIPAAFVPDPHPKAVKEVRLDIDGFPEIRTLRAEVRELRATLRQREGSLVGTSAPMRHLLTRLARVASAKIPVLVLGETGVGKELVARAVHEQSARAHGPFVAENCGAFTPGLLAGELFGHEKGAFTGATRRHRGLFEQAHRGTLFLDEIGEMEPRVQAHLLRVLQEGTVRRVGAETTLDVDVRIIAATHRPLAELVARGEFREDLYYRLRGAELIVPPLRERADDIPELVEYFLRNSDAQGRRVTATAFAAMQGYRWPGNVRELQAEVTRWAVFCGQRIDRRDLSPEIVAQAVPAPAVSAAPVAVQSLATAVAETERVVVTHAFETCGHNILRTAKALGIDRNTLKRKLTLYGLRD